MKFLIISLFIILSQFSESHSRNKLEKKLNSLKKQTVELHNNIISNNKELKIIKLDIDRNRQKQIIYLRYIKDKEVLGKQAGLQQELFRCSQESGGTYQEAWPHNQQGSTRERVYL